MSAEARESNGQHDGALVPHDNHTTEPEESSSLLGEFGAGAGVAGGLYATERQHTIMKVAQRDGRVSVSALADTFGVVPETIRRDLAMLERRGALVRVHGGAILADASEFETAIATRAHTMTAEKRRIAVAALRELPIEGSIFIEAGNTPGHLVEVLPHDRKLTVVTNAGYIAEALAPRPSLTVMNVGGRLRRKTLACVDDWALSTLAGLYVDVAFLGTNGVSVARGLTTPDAAEAAVKRATLSISRRRVLLADHTKIGAITLCRYGEVADLDVIVTDDGLNREHAEELESAGPEVIRA